MSDNNQILRLLATIREEVAGIRSRQEELYELLLGYKDQIHEVKQAVSEGLAGLPSSPYIAGQLVPAPDQVDGVDDFGQMLAAYLAKAPRGVGRTPPRDVSFDPPGEVDPDEIVLEKGESENRKRRRGSGGGGGGGRGDNDLQRGPDRGVVQIDLDDDEDDDDDDDDELEGEGEAGGEGKSKRRRRRRRRGKKKPGA